MWLLVTLAFATSSTTAAPPPLPELAVTYRQRPVFLIADDGTRDTKERVRRLSEALQAAIDAPARADPDSPNVAVNLVSTSTLVVTIRGYLVGQLYAKDARAAHQESMDAYARTLEDGLGLFVADHRRKAALQGSALRVFAFALILVIGLLVLRLTRHGFRRADDYLDDRAGSLRPISLLGVPIIGAEALSAGAALAIAIGRIVSYVGIVAVTLALALSQFDRSRTWVSAVVGWASPPLLDGFQQLLLALPRLALAALLLVVGSGALRVVRVLFDDSGSHRTSWDALTPERARVMRVLASIAVIMVIAPLAVAAVFGRFHTPLELLVVAAAASGALAMAPLLASGVVGLATIWRRKVSVGDVIAVRGVRGRVTSVTPWDLEIESDRGRTTLPMLTLLATQIVHDLPQRSSIRVTAKRDGSVRDTLAAIQKVAEDVVPGMTVTCARFDANEVELLIDPKPGMDLDRILLALSDAGVVSAKIETRG